MDCADRRLFSLVRDQLLALGPAGLDASAITRDSLLIEDVGLDSLKFVDLTVALEDALGIEEFPMQAWVDGQQEAQGVLSVGALVDACAELLAARTKVAS